MEDLQLLALADDKGSALLPVRVKPGARANALEGLRGTALLVSVTAAPTDGEANKAVIALLAKTLRHPKSLISIARGHTARDKWLRLEGLSSEEARTRLASKAN